MTEQADQVHPNAAQTRVTVAEAAQLLNLSAEAVRSRVQRGTLPSVKVDGTVYVLLDVAQTRPDAAQTDERVGTQTHLSGDQTEFIASLQGQIDWLRREVERKDTLLMSLMQRIPELEAPRETSQEPRENPETASEEPYSTHAPPMPETPVSDAQHKRSWWRAFFGLE